MGMVVRTNTMALNAYRQLGMNNSAVTKSLEKLSSGFRINRAGDDAAGLAISEKMKAQIKGLETASANAQDGISLIQTAEGNLSEVHDMLNRMVELATKSANGTYTQTERDALQAEVDALLSEIDRISKSANFNGAKLLDGSLNSASYIQETNIPIIKDEATDPTTQVGKKTVLHTEGTELKKTSFSVDLHDLVFNTTDDEKTLKVTIGDSVTLNLTFNAGTAVTAGDIAGKIAEVFADGTNGADGKINDVAFTVSADGNKVTFTQTDDPESLDEIIDANLAVKVENPNAKEGTGDYTPTGLTVTQPDSATVTFGDSLGVPGIDDHAMISFDLDGFSVDKAGTVSFTVAGKTYDVEITDEDIAADADGTTPLDEAVAGKLITAINADKPEDADAGAFTADIGDDGLGNTVATAVVLTAANADTPVTDTTTFQNGTLTVAEKQVEEASNGLTGTYNAETTVNTQGQLDAPGALASTKFELKEEIIKDGNVLTIGKQNYIFKTDADSKVEKGDGQVLIDISGYADSKKLDMAGELISREANSAFTVGYDKANNTITIHEIEGQKDYTKELESVKEFDKLVYYNGSVKANPNGKALTLQIGDTADDFNTMEVNIADMSSNGLGIGNLSIADKDSAKGAIKKITDAINTVSTVRADMGALQNRLEHTINNLDVTAENLSAANSRIRDTDMAKEMMNYTKMNVLVQSAQAMLAQANQQPQSVLQLLQ